MHSVALVIFADSVAGSIGTEISTPAERPASTISPTAFSDESVGGKAQLISRHAARKGLAAFAIAEWMLR